METILTITYITFSWIIFKVFKIPVNKWTLTTDILGGAIMLSVIFMSMAYFHPASKTARSYFVTTNMMPLVRGRLTEIAVQPNTPIKKGDLLFKIDPTKHEGQVADYTAQLIYAKKRLKDVKELRKVAGGSKFDIDDYTKEVGSLTGKLQTAQFQLDSCTVYAAANGYVTQIRVRPGQLAVAFPFMPVLTFVNTDARYFVAGFTQSPLTNIRPGQHAEVTFPALPGRIFQAEIEKVLPAMAEGEIQTERKLFSFTQELPPGLVPVMVKITEDMSSYNLPMGVEAVVATYTDVPIWGEIALIRKILMRMESWSNFLHFH